MHMSDLNKRDALLFVSKKIQYRTAEELIEKSRPSQAFWTLLALSSIIITAGLLLNNVSIVIGGMLVTPLLTPILVVAMGIAVGEISLIKRTFFLVLQSAGFVIIGALILSFIFGNPQELTILDNSLRTAMLYFVVAIASGVAATIAWTRKEIIDTLPGVSIAVSLVPPLALVGINLSRMGWDNAGFWLGIFTLNLIGITIGSLVVFSLSHFNNSAKVIKQKNEEVVVEDHLKKLSKDLKKDLQH